MDCLVGWSIIDWLIGWMDGLIDWLIDWLTDGRMDGWMDGWMDGLIDGRTDGWTDGRTDGWMDGWMDGWIDCLIALHSSPCQPGPNARFPRGATHSGPNWLLLRRAAILYGQQNCIRLFRHLCALQRGTSLWLSERLPVRLHDLWCLLACRYCRLPSNGKHWLYLQATISVLYPRWSALYSVLALILSIVRWAPVNFEPSLLPYTTLFRCQQDFVEHLLYKIPLLDTAVKSTKSEYEQVIELKTQGGRRRRRKWNDKTNCRRQN